MEQPLYTKVDSSLAELATKGTTEWVWYNGGEKPTGPESFWGDLKIRKGPFDYILSLYCGYVRYERVANRDNGAIRHKRYGLGTVRLKNWGSEIKQIWARDKKRGIKLTPSNDVYAIKATNKGKPDPADVLAIGCKAQRGFDCGNSLFIRTKTEYDYPYPVCDVAVVMNGEEIPWTDAFYSKALYEYCLYDKSNRGEKALAYIESRINSGECSKEDKTWDDAYGEEHVKIEVYSLNSENPIFGFYCYWGWAYFLHKGLAIMSRDNRTPEAGLHIGNCNCRYPVYGIPDERFKDLVRRLYKMPQAQHTR